MIRATLKESGTTPLVKEELMIDVMIANRPSRHSFSNMVGIGSRPQVFVGELLITDWTCLGVTGAMEFFRRNRQRR